MIADILSIRTKFLKAFKQNILEQNFQLCDISWGDGVHRARLGEKDHQVPCHALLEGNLRMLCMCSRSSNYALFYSYTFAL